MEKYVTVIPVEYPRSSRQYGHSSHQYSDFIEDSLNSYNENDKIVNHERDANFVSRNNRQTAQSSFRKDATGSQSLRICVYLMNEVVLHMALEDGINTTAMELIQAIIKHEEINLPDIASCVFSMWMCSGLLELQLKSNHKPMVVRWKWPSLLKKYSHASLSKQLRNEPILSFQRNVFFPLREEEKITDSRILELLYEEAKYNVLEGRYPCEISQYIMLGGIQARLELGPYNPQVHTNKFFRSQKNKFLPLHMRHDILTSWFRLRVKNSPEVRLMEHYKRIPVSATDRKLQRKYLEVCWSLPYYGCVFFQGQIEEPVRGLTSLLMCQDLPIIVGINERGVYIIDNANSKLLLGLGYEDFSWELATPCNSNNPDCLPCIFLQFMVVENGARVSKILQVFSKQSSIMDSLITTFVEQIKYMVNNAAIDTRDGNGVGQGQMIQEPQFVCLPNKLNRMTLATFDTEGRCIGEMGSLSFGYQR